MPASDMYSYGSLNLNYIEKLYEDYLNDPNSVEEQWRAFFESENAGDLLPVKDTDDEPTGTDGPIRADPHPIIHKSEVHQKKGAAPHFVGEFIRHIPLFENLSDLDLQRLAEIIEEVDIKAEVVLCREGQFENDLFLLRSGSASVMRQGQEISQLKAGDLIGELAVFDERPRSAAIVSKTSCELLRIKHRDLHQLLRQNQPLTMGLLQALANRLRVAGSAQEQVDSLIRAYRERGHVLAKLDPLDRERGESHPALTMEHYGFHQRDLNRKFSVALGSFSTGRTLRDILERLNNVYCQSIGAQYMHIDKLQIQNWLRVRLEDSVGTQTLSRPEQVRILRKLTDAEVFENFVHRKFVGAKRFSLEGTESLIPLLDYAIEQAGSNAIDEVVIGMAHRGRLNVLVNILDKPPSRIFREFLDVDPELSRQRGDVKYHLGFGCNRVTSSGRKVHISLCFNPSHLEFVGPVVLGRVRSKQDRFGDHRRERALPLIIHGDAAFTGQGVVQELFNLSELPGYSTGGSIHIVLNNQIGFTTNPEDSRTSQYCTDVARMLQIPIFHVNGEDPEAVALVIRLAMDFRQEFKKDVVIDMYGYRKYGHNEGDDPVFTQPLLYRTIKQRKTVRSAYVENLLKLKNISRKETEEIAEDSKRHLERELATSQHPDFEAAYTKTGKGIWAAYTGGVDRDAPQVKTGLPLATLQSLLKQISSYPSHFKPHSKIKRFLKNQMDMGAGKKPINWGSGEALAFASLLAQGKPIRLTGQDSERGTFSHRHAVLHDNETGEKYTPLKMVGEKPEHFEIYNSPLSEIAVLGFEYGYSIDSPEGLCIWEAQFGDFCNVAQVIIDQFISSSEEKWGRLSGLCLFLPHGFEGQGPEHSSARLERFLMLSAVDNLQVVNLTTPAQLFHCLRRQVLRPLRKPLIVMSPKSLLRHPKAVSSLDDLVEGTFQKIIPDSPEINKHKVERVLLCSGKIYYELEEKREVQRIANTAILRMEQYYPLPDCELREVLCEYPKGIPVYWVQEEPLNMGAWSFLKLRFGTHIKGNGVHPLRHYTRAEAASPASGSASSHKIEQAQLIGEALGL